MPTITLTLPVAGNGITAGLHATNYAALQALLNGDLDGDNIDPATVLAITSATLSGVNGLVLSGAGGKDTLNLSSTTTETGLTIGGDVSLYRNEANVLKTDDKFVIGNANGLEFSDGSSIVSTAYSTYVPTLTASTVNPTLGAASTQSGRYIKIGKFVHCFGCINVGGAGFAAGTGDYRISLPVTAAAPIANAKIGSAKLVDASAVAIALPQCQMVGAGTGTFSMSYPAAWPSGASTQVGAAAPWAWAQGDELYWEIAYQAA